LSRTLRLEIAHGCKITDYAGPEFKEGAAVCRREDLIERQNIGVLTIELNYFSVYNNQWDYNRANVLMLIVERSLLQQHPWLIVRSGGGTLSGFISCIPAEGRDALLERISSEVTNQLKQAVADSPDSDRMLAEHYERRKLAEIGAKEFGLRSIINGFPSVSISYRDESVYNSAGKSREVGDIFRDPEGR